jgi:hypothetical protein
MNNEVTDTHWQLKQGCNVKEIMFKPRVVDEYQNDIAAVVDEYHLPAINYRDLSRQHALSEALSRWPLLAELNSVKAEV